MVKKEELNDEWIDLPVSIIHRMQDSDYIVFTNSADDFDWCFNNAESQNGYDLKKHNQLITRLTEINTKDYNVSNKNIKKQFHELLADAFCNIYNCDYENAENSLSIAETFILKHHKEATRVWIVSSSVITTVICVLAGILFITKIDVSNNNLLRYVIYSLFGSIGVCIASFMKLNTRFVLIEVGVLRVIIESVCHVVIGIFLSFVALLCIKYKLFFSFLNDLSKDSEVLIAILFATCEGFFPAIINNFDKKITSEVENVE